jgi:hypothetical protein
MSVILATCKIEIGLSGFEASPGKKFVIPPSQPIPGHSGTCLSFQAVWEVEIRRIIAPGQPWQKCLQDSILMGKRWIWWYVPVI